MSVDADGEIQKREREQTDIRSIRRGHFSAILSLLGFEMIFTFYIYI